MHAVERWFGDGFDTLHPALRDLHRRGGTLRGPVTIEFGRGLAGRIGRRLAQRMGVPVEPGETMLRVDIRSDGDVLHWHRLFGASHTMASRFVPVGAWPGGHWLETTGPLRLALSVDTTHGDWRWQPRAAWLHGARIPLALLPQVRAGKRIDARDGYVFDVAVTLPWFGLLFRYGGTLVPDA